MSETTRLPEGAFVPSHGRGFLKPAKRFQPGNKAGLGNKSNKGYSRVDTQTAAQALEALYPALAEALAAPSLTRRAWWRKRYTALVRAYGGNVEAVERHVLGLLLLRTPADPIPRMGGYCHQCGLRLQGEALPLVGGGTVSGWVHPHCLLPASRIQLQKARDALAKALEPWK